jgi:DNA-binding NtrC family response regulator
VVSATAGPEGTATPRRSPTVLLVEDDPSALAIARAWLRKLGCVVIVAADGREAGKLAAQRTEPIDVLLVDVMLPGMHGPAAVGVVHRHHPEAAVIFTSGFSPELVSEMFAVHHGKAPLLTKPYTFERLESVLHAALAGRKGAAPINPRRLRSSSVSEVSSS